MTNTTDTVNFTVAVDRDLLQRATLIAAKSGISLNALFDLGFRMLVEQNAGVAPQPATNRPRD